MRNPISPEKEKDYMGENISITPDFTEKVHRWVTGEDLMDLGSTLRSPIP